MAMLLQCISTPVQGDKAEAAEGTHCNVIRTPASQQQRQQQCCNIRVLKMFLADARQNANQLLEPIAVIMHFGMHIVSNKQLLTQHWLARKAELSQLTCHRVYPVL